MGGLRAFRFRFLTHSPPPPAQQEWRDLMSLLATESCDMYRSVVYRTPEFYEYFMQSTAAR